MNLIDYDKRTPGSWACPNGCEAGETESTPIGSTVPCPKCGAQAAVLPRDPALLAAVKARLEGASLLRQVAAIDPARVVRDGNVLTVLDEAPPLDAAQREQLVREWTLKFGSPERIPILKRNPSFRLVTERKLEEKCPAEDCRGVLYAKPFERAGDAWVAACSQCVYAESGDVIDTSRLFTEAVVTVSLEMAPGDNSSPPDDEFRITFVEQPEIPPLPSGAIVDPAAWGGERGLAENPRLLHRHDYPALAGRKEGEKR